MQVTHVAPVTAGSPAIDVRNLRKAFSTPRRQPGVLGALAGLFPGAPRDLVTAINGISFQIPEGQFVGLLGPNGAGKSTTVKVLTGILHPTSGEASVNGLVPWQQREAHARQIGVVFGQRTQLWWDLPVIDSLDMLRRIYEVPWERYHANLRRLTDVLGLGEFLKTPARRLSLGQRVRSDLAAALLHEPPVLFLDEPTVGVDLLAKDRLRTFLREINRERGVTVLLTTHDMAELEQLCERIMVIDHGGLVYDGSLAELRSRLGTTRELVIQLDDAGTRAVEEQALVLPEGAWLQRHTGPQLVLAFDRDRISTGRLVAALQEQLNLDDFSVQEPDAEALVKRVYLQGLQELDGVRPERNRLAELPP